LADRLEVTRLLCFVLMPWHKSHDRANSLALVSRRLTNRRRHGKVTP
jgi:hypothetical protein